MDKRRYQVKLFNNIIAENMDLNTAVILIKAFYKEFDNETNISLTIEIMKNKEED